MKKSLLSLAVAALCASMASPRTRTRDSAITYRMSAGYPGSVNRTHPASIYPALQDTTTPIRLYGDPGVYDSTNNTVRGFTAGDDGLTKLSGVLVRPYPTQQTSGGMSSSFGSAAPPGAKNVVDIIEDGSIMVKCNNVGAGAPAKGKAVWVWTAASSGAHVQGGFEAIANAGNAAAVVNAQWNGPADANGTAELLCWKQG